MPMLKLLGVLLLVGAGTSLGAAKVGWERKRLRVLDEWIALLDRIRTQINCFLRPLREILAETDPSLTHGKQDPEEILSDSEAYLPPDAAGEIRTFLAGTGEGFREEQLDNCDRCLEKLRKIREDAAKELPGKIRISLALGVCGACGAAILLW